MSEGDGNPPAVDEGAIGVRPAVGRAHHARLRGRSRFGAAKARGELSAFLQDVREQAVGELLAAGQARDLVNPASFVAAKRMSVMGAA